MGTLTAVGLLPNLLFSLPAGVWLDRVRSRRRLMVAADLGRAALIASIPVAFVLGALSMPQLYVVGFLTGSLTVIFDLSWNTLFVTVTQRERYVEAMALLNGSRSLASVAGPTVGGILVQVFGAPLAMLVDAVSYLGSVFFLRRIRSPEPPVETEEGTTREKLLAGLSFVGNDSIMRPTLLSVATINLFTFASSALFILYATTELGVSPGALGLALGMGAVGAVIGALVATRVGRRIGLRARLRARLPHLPGLAAVDPGGCARDVDDGDPCAALRFGVRCRVWRDDPRHQRRGDHLRADA